MLLQNVTESVINDWLHTAELLINLLLFFRDSSELQKPTSTNLAVIRFYKYVQAARDGQDQRDCLRLYPACSVNTEEWK